MYTCVLTCIRICTCTCTDVCMYAYIHMHAYMHTYIHTCIAAEQSTGSNRYSTAIDYDARPGLFGGSIGLFCANIQLFCAACTLEIPVGAGMDSDPCPRLFPAEM